MIRATISSSSALRREAAADFLREHDPAQEVVLIAPSREAADDVVRHTLRDGAAATFGLHRFGISQLYSHLATPLMAARGLAPATSLAMQAAAARAAFEARSRDELPELTEVSSFPGFPRALTATLAELRLAGLDPDQLAGDAGEIAALLDGFTQQLHAGSAADRSRLIQLATEAVADSPDPILSAPMFVTDVALRSPHERDFLAALARRSPRLEMTVATGDDDTLRWLSSIDGVEVEESAETSGNTLARLRREVFSTAPTEDRHEPDTTVTFFSAPGEGRECVEIVRHVLQLAAEGIPLDQQAVFLRAPQIYAGLLEAAFRRAEVPVFSTRGTRQPDPTGRAFLALLACRSEGLSARRFAEYLSFAVVPALEDGAPPQDGETWAPPQEETLGPRSVQEPGEQLAFDFDAEPADTTEAPRLSGSLRAPWKWEHVLVESAVIGGAHRWRRRLDGYQNELAVRRQELAEREPESPRLEGLDRDLANVQHLRAFALPVIEGLDKMPARAKWGEWLDRLSQLAPQALGRPERVLSILSEMRPMAAIGPVSLDEVRTVLADTLSTLETNPPEQRYGHVFVGTPEQARGHSFRAVFVPGLAERVFPERPREDPLLLDDVRTAVDETLTTQEQRGQRERLLLRLALGGANERVILSYPRVNVREARPRVPSFYAIDVDRASRGQSRDFSQLEREAEDQVHARLAWPAPHDADHSVDAAEHDLAVLHDLLHRDPADVKGRARYLLELNQHLARSLRTRWQRFESRHWRAQDGMVELTDAIREAIESQSLQKRPYSVTALQRFATCPYQFFLGAIHRLQPREDVVSPVQMDPLTRGTLMHQVQAEILRELRDAGELPVKPANLESSTRKLDATLDRVAQRFYDDIAPAIDRVWEDEVVGMRTDLRVWMRILSEDADTWVPRWFEYAFGLPGREGHDAESRAEPVKIPGDWLLRGAIDMIEHSLDGTKLRVTDHKTGLNRTSVGTVVGCGEVLQPALYSLVAETALGKPVVEGRLSFATARGGFSDRVVPIDDRARYYANQVLEIIERAVGEGMLPPAPKEGACKWCDFRPVCGPHEEARLKRKDKTKLEDLRELRLLP